MRRVEALALVLLAAASATALGGAPVRAAPAATPAVQPSTAAAPPLRYRERTLANGLRVFSAVDRATPNVTVQVWYGVGSKNDPQGRSGFAHLFEHLMFKATRDMAAENLDRLTEDVGGENNASTWDDLTNYYEVVPANHLQRLLWAEAQRMSTLQVDQSNFVSERAVVKEELRQSYLANPYGRLNLAVQDASYETHPYKRSTIGSLGDLDAATLADVRAFHDTFYRPDNASLIVIGNLDEARLDAWVDAYFGGVAKPAFALPRVTAVEPPRTAPKTVTAYAPVVPLPATAITWHIPAASSPDAPALRVADAILSTGKSSRLYRDLVYARQIASEIGSEAGRNQQPGLFMVQSVMAGAHTPVEGETALRAEIARLRDAPVDADELARAKNQLVSASLQRRETLIGQGFQLGFAVVVEGDPARVNRDLADLQAVTAADVQRVARRYLRDEARVVVRYLPESARPAGEAPAPDLAQFSPHVNVDTPPADVVAAPAPASLPHAAPPVSAPVAPTPPTIAMRTLANGLQVIVARTSDLPIATAALGVKSGAAADPAGLAGLQGFTTELLAQGTAGRSATELAAAIESLGGELHAAAGADNATLSLTVPVDQLSAALPLIGDAARHPVFAPEEIERLRAQKLDELTVEMKSPGAVARMAAAPLVFGAGGYGRVATPASIKGITRAGVVAQYAATFRPDNAVLVITGGVAPEAGFALAQAAFGDWARPAAPLPSAPSVMASGVGARPASAGPRVVVIDIPGAGQAAVSVVAPTLARIDPDFRAAQVANGVLGGGYSARLNAEVRVRRGLSYGAGSRIDARRGGGLFTASAQTKNESAGEVAQIMLDLVRDLSARPVGDGELAPRKAALIGGRGLEARQSDRLAGILVNDAVYGVDPAEVAGFTQAIEAVTGAQAQAAAARAIDAARAAVVIVGDGKALLPAVRQRFPGVEVVAGGTFDPAALARGG